MNNEEKLSLPRSGYEVITKILHAYALCSGKPASLLDVASKAGLDKTVVSRNNGFLNSLGLLSGGNLKTLTEEGKELAIALGNDMEEDAALSWRRTFLSAPSAKPVLDMLQVQKQIPKEQFVGKVASALGVVSGKAGVSVGINTLAEILLRSGLLKEADGKYSIVSDIFDAPTEAPVETQKDIAEPNEETHLQSTGQSQIAAPEGTPAQNAAAKFQIPIHVNIELHLPASSEQAVYDALFKSIRENLME